MFKKKPQIKNLSSLRSSDRRKLADQIISEYQIHIPINEPSASEKSDDPPDNGPSASLTSIRLSLLPENCSSGRFVIHSGPDAKLLSGTLYVGSPPGEEQRILWFQVGPTDHRLYPTVYTLWRNSALVPLLHTPGVVVDKLRTGADLMTPGLARGPPFPQKAKKNSVVAVASVEKPAVPVFVGVCEIDVSQLDKVRGVKGHAVRGIHWEGDQLWTWSSTGMGGADGCAETMKGWQSSADISSLNEGMKELATAEDDLDDQDQGGVSLEPAHHDTSPREYNQGQPEREVSVQEIDDAFYNAFLYAIYSARKKRSPPYHGIDFPVGPSFLVANLIQPFLPIQSIPEGQCTIKKSSWKTTKKFIKHLDKQGLVKAKDRNGGETVILDLDFEHRQILDFTPYHLPRPKENDSGSHGQMASKAPGVVLSDVSLEQKLHCQFLIRPSPKLVPHLLPNQTAFYTPQEVSAFLRAYIDHDPDLTSQSSSPRFVKLNPFLANHILGSSTSAWAQAIDTKALVAGEIARDILQKRLLEDNRLCQTYWVLLRGSQRWSHEASASLPKPKPGLIPKLSIVIEKRTGTKTVTKVGNLEVFGIQPELLATTLQKKCASSTNVSQRVGGKPGQMEVLIQGDQRDVVKREVGKQGVEEKWIEVTDKAKQKGNK